VTGRFGRCHLAFPNIRTPAPSLPLDGSANSLQLRLVQLERYGQLQVSILGLG
jgi:hypothetical protein